MDEDLVRNVARLAEFEIGRKHLLLLSREHWWGWDAARLTMPEVVKWPRPKRRRGRDAHINIIRNMMVFHEVEEAIASGMSDRAAYRAVADKRAMITHKAIGAIHGKVRQRLARNT